ncbi:MAG TPA: BTAD domain-containing putative transcriptional regulator [Gemmatimonadales bacterium]|jgi:DNA-binding SARP family transcriptional activator/TolB-like protein
MFTLRMLGGASLDGPDGPVPGRAGLRQRVALLAVLAVEHPRPVSRDKIVANLWPESGTDEGRHQLRDTLYIIRSALGDDSVLSTGDDLRLNLERLTCDLWEFDAALLRDDPAAAVGIYHGPLLSGFHLPESEEFEPWAEGKRALLARRYIQAIEQLAEREMQRGDAVRAVEWWARLAAEDPYNSRIAMRYMQALEAAGDRAGAMRHAGVHSELLRTELGAVPEGEVVAMAERLRHESRGGTRAPASPDPASTPDPSWTSGVEPPAPLAVETSRPSRRRWILPAALLLALTVGLGALRTARSHERSPELNPRRVAVAVFQNRTGRADLDDLGSMTGDWIIRGLMETPLIDVTDLEAVYARRADGSGEWTEPRTQARRNGAGLVVSGSYYRSGDSVLFEANLMDVTSGRVLRSFPSVGAPAGNPADALDELRDAIAAGLGALIDPASRTSPVDPDLVPPPSYPAYREFIAGLRSRTQHDWEVEAGHYRRSAELDSTFVAPLIQLAYRATWSDRCQITDSIASALDGRHTLLTTWDRFTIDLLRARCRGEMATAVRLLGERFEAYPHSVTAARQYQSGLQRANQPRASRKVLSDLRRTVDGADQSDQEWGPYWWFLAASHHMLGEYAAEIEITNSSRDSSSEGWLETRGRALAALGRETEVLQLIRSVSARSIDSVAAPSLTIATELAAHGHQGTASAVAESTLRRLDLSPGVEPHRAINVALANLLLGRREEERRALEQIARSDADTLRLLEAEGRIAVLLADTGRAGRIDRMLAEQSDRPLRDPTIRGPLIVARAHIAAGFGRREQAVMLLRDASARGILRLGPSHDYHVDPLLAPLRGYPPFEALLQPDN